MTPACSVCAHWMGDRLDRRRKGPRHGTCIAARCFTDFSVRAPAWCHECDPYSMSEPELRTREDFHCKHFVSQDSAAEREEG